MGFIEEYKRLDRLCQDTMKAQSGIKAYTEEMEAHPKGYFYVESWNTDLKMLYHCRRIRNKISHEPGCSEDNMCSSDDELWLVRFYERILKQTDPLALYRKSQNTQTRSAVQTAQAQPVMQTVQMPPATQTAQSEESSIHRIAPKKSRKRILPWFGKVVISLLLVTILIFLIMIVKEFLQLI